MRSRSSRGLVDRALTAIAIASVAMALPAGAQVVSITAGAPTVESFDAPAGLVASGTGGQTPTGWSFVEAGSNANALYTASDGSANGGDTYSFGASGANERALGALLSGSLTPTIGAQLRNDTGASLSAIVVRYTGEQWRLGTLGRVDRLDFQWSADATSLTSGTWTSADALDFVAPVSSGTVGGLNGNAAAQRTLIEATLSGIALAPGATLWVRWNDLNASGADDGLAIDDASFGVSGGGGDVPPTVASTVPADGAGNVALAANLTVTFSEAVSVTPPWFTIQCASGARAASASGGPIIFTLDPALDFASADSCTVTVLAANVVDQDGMPTPMAANVAWTFTAAADVPPQVIATTPVNAASNVGLANNLAVTFSEPVSASSASFGIDCGAGALGYALANQSQTIWILDPAANLPPATACTLTIVASQISDLDGAPDALPANVSVAFTTGQGAQNYYAGVDASSCLALRASLHALIDDHVVLAYTTPPANFQPTTNTWTMLEAADQNPNNVAQILDVYRNRSYTKITDRASSTCTSGSACYNREHTWPNSLGFGSTTGDLGVPSAPYTDGHMLHLSAVDWNADRGNRPYANCPPPGCGARATDAQPAPFDGSGGTCSYPAGNCNWVQSPDGSAGSFETWSKRRGDMARAMFYMDVRYEGGVAGAGANTAGQSEPDLVLTDDRALIQATSASPAYMGLRADLLGWHVADPPTAGDLLRNDVIQSFQGNRNPFVDHPEWVAIAFASPCTGATDAIFDSGFEELR